MKNTAGKNTRLMTALRQYQRLESGGLWRETPQGHFRDVIVSFGEASLVISDPRTEAALSHWSLPAVERLNPGAEPARFSPGVDAGELLEIEEGVMIGALEKVRGVVTARQARSGSLRIWATVMILAGVLAAGVFWLPGALVEHTASVVPLAKRAEISRRVLEDLGRSGVLTCRTALGARASDRLRDRVLGPEGGEIVFLESGLSQSAHLPGRMILIGRSLLEAHDAPEIVAGHVIAERMRADAEDPMLPLLRNAGLQATLRLLTTGDLPESAIRGYGAAIIAQPREPLSVAEFKARMEAAGVPTTPYAFSVDPSGEDTLPLIEGDPFRAVPPRPVLADGDWVSLQGICSG